MELIGLYSNISFISKYICGLVDFVLKFTFSLLSQWLKFSYGVK